MKVIIIEDEKPAADKLQNALRKTHNGIQVIAILKSIAESVRWIETNPAPDLIFMDIELSDGSSFKIFDQATVNCPIIFITAYDDYWQEAFEHNSIEYLLKPIKQEKLASALSKYQTLKKHFSQNFDRLMQFEDSPVNAAKKRFLVKRGIDYISVKTEDIAYFYAIHKLVCLVDKKGNKFMLDQSLTELEKQVDRVDFYRINRKFLVHIDSIRKIKSYPKSKIQVEIDPPVMEEIIISQENVASFKQWMEQ